MNVSKRPNSRLHALKDAFQGPGLSPALMASGAVLAAFLVGFLLRSVSIWASVIAAVIILFAVCIGCLMWFQNHVTEPIEQMTESVKKIAEGSYGTELPPSNDESFEQLRTAINEVSQEISRTEKMQSEFISSISHELRTPLTAITGWGETLMFDMSIKRESREGIKTILREASILTGLVEELLEFTRIQDGRFKLNIELLDIEAELEDTIFTYRELLQKDKIDLRYTPMDEVLPLVPGDALRLRQVFLNILDNAAKYGRDGGVIDVSLTATQKSATIIFRDYGPGIPEDELPHVKEKFFKGRISKERGSGIGLAVCDEIVTRSGGTLTIINAPGGGTAVAVTLPFAPEHSKAHTTEVIS